VVAIYSVTLAAHRHALDREELLLETDPGAGITGEIAGAPDHSMARDDDGQRIVPERLGHRAHRFRSAHALRDAAIGGDRSVGQVGGGREDTSLELARRPAKVQGPAEPGSPSVQIVEQLAVDGLEGRGVLHHFVPGETGDV
jgi:hypothetical protein